MKKLFDAITADDTTTDNNFAADGARRLTVHAFGTFGGGTVTVYLSANGTSNGVAPTELIFTADGIQTLDVADGITIWATLSGATAPTISLFIAGIGND